jgi:hypothetical protein
MLGYAKPMEHLGVTHRQNLIPKKVELCVMFLSETKMGT